MPESGSIEPSKVPRLITSNITQVQMCTCFLNSKLQEINHVYLYCNSSGPDCPKLILEKFDEIQTMPRAGGLQSDNYRNRV